MVIRENVEIMNLTTMRLGGKARYVVEITKKEELPEAYIFAKRKEVPVYVLGTGSNIIGRDEGFSGLILVNKIRGIEIIEEKDDILTLKGFGGEMLDDFIAFGAERGYSGMEAMSAIPGTLGAAPVQNVGAYGQDISQTIVEVEAFDSKTLNYLTLDKSQMKLGYRKSIFNHGSDAGRYFIVSVTVRLSRHELAPPFYNSLQAYIDTHKITDFSPMSIRTMVTAIRNSKLPDPKTIASAGSFFKNIYLSEEEAEKAKQRGIMVWDGGKVPAGWLIENAGLKGQEFYGFRVSDKAALVLINEKATKYADLEKARQAISDAVFKKFGLRLEQEPVELVG